MSDKQITIRMPKKLLAKWLAALRSGGYVQTTGIMYEPETCGFCCLGVLQHVASRGSVEVGELGFWMTAPSERWLRTNGISFADYRGGASNRPYLPTLHETATIANDAGKTFAEIADAIEACAEGV